jgi:hypothetical protein
MNEFGVKKQEYYAIGDMVLIVDGKTLKSSINSNPSGKMNKYAGSIMTIVDYDSIGQGYKMKEDGRKWFWYPEMIRGKIIPLWGIE